MRTQQEIAAKMSESMNSNQLFDFTPDVLLPFMDYEHAKPFLKETVTAMEWMTHSSPSTDEAVLAEAKEYMAEYGWDKALNHRGLSANRTINKMQAWMWLVGNDELADLCASGNYSQYGAPVLAAICQHYNWPIPDDEAAKNMIAGRPCRPDCEEGCSN
jgi:hypothetical protein